MPKSNSDSEARIADVGVVIVHGIGNQGQAAILLDYAEPLVAWADSWSRARGGAGAEVKSALLRASDDIARVEIQVGLPDGTSMSWLMTEARWSESFPPPDPAEVFQWGRRFVLTALSRLWTHFTRPSDLAWDDANLETSTAKKAVLDDIDEQARAAADGGIVSAATSGSIASGGIMAGVALWLVAGFITLHFLAYVGIVAGAFAAGLLLTWVVVSVLSIAVKVPIVKGKVAGVVTALVTTVGDAAVLRQRPVRAAAMVDVVLERLTWIHPRARSIVVVAHSQGAPVSYKALLHEQAPQVRAFMTIGAAVSLLGDDTQPVTTWSPRRHREVRIVSADCCHDHRGRDRD